MTRIRHILFASDFSKTSAKAFRTALVLAKASGARMTILHVNVPVLAMPPETLVDVTMLQQLDADAHKWAERRVTALGRKAKDAGVRAVGLVMDGLPADQIVRAARTRRANLIVLGTHGRTGLNKFFLGSVASQVIASARCAVVTVKGT